MRTTCCTYSRMTEHESESSDVFSSQGTETTHSHAHKRASGNNDCTESGLSTTACILASPHGRSIFET